MAPASTPAPDGPLPVTPELANAARVFRLRMAVIDRETETALDMTRDHYGRTVHAAAAAARAQRDKSALEAYTTHLAPHADALLDAARRALDELPPARHLAGWRAVLDGLVSSAAEIRRALDRPTAPGSPAEHAQHAALWPHLTAWADHSVIASNLADQRDGQHHKAPLTEEEQRMWTELAQAAHRRGELELTESWYAADGQPITLAHLIEDDDSTLVALRGDPDAPGWQVIGHYAHEYEAGRYSLPRSRPVCCALTSPGSTDPSPPLRSRCRNSPGTSSRPRPPVTRPTRSSVPPSAVTAQGRWSVSKNSWKRAASSPAH